MNIRITTSTGTIKAELVDYRPHVFLPMTKAYRVIATTSVEVRVGENIMPRNDGRGGFVSGGWLVGHCAVDCFGHDGEVAAA